MSRGVCALQYFSSNSNSVPFRSRASLRFVGVRQHDLAMSVGSRPSAGRSLRALFARRFRITNYEILSHEAMDSLLSIPFALLVLEEPFKLQWKAEESGCGTMGPMLQ